MMKLADSTQQQPAYAALPADRLDHARYSEAAEADSAAAALVQLGKSRNSASSSANLIMPQLGSSVQRPRLEV